MPAKHTLARPPKETPLLYHTDGEGKEALVYAHYFLTGTRVNIFVTEYDPVEDLAFGWSMLDNFEFGEFGYTAMSELEELEIKTPIYLFGEKFYFPQRVELDQYWTRKSIKDALATLQ